MSGQDSLFSPVEQTHSDTTICTQHEHVVQRSMETHVHYLCALCVIFAPTSNIWFLWGCVTTSLKYQLPLSVRSTFSPSLSDFWVLSSHFLWIFFSLPLFSPSLECSFSYTMWFISPTPTTPVLPVLYRRNSDLDSPRNTHMHAVPLAEARTRMLTHCALLRHSPVVWPVTTTQLFLLSCHVSPDVRALLCVIGWRLLASFICGR